ncbi:MAG: cytochrome c biogenesis protein CcmG/thiol:disulfide interchange protein DsbE [Arenicella sp.]|jgi:cytochrome c biogenesis protein CcmG/thiol:disulfide interchange protein DsbE
MKLNYIIPLVAFFALAVLLGKGLTLDPKAIPSTRIDKPAPSFELPVLSTTDEIFTPEDLKGQRWVLNVWASWCVSCRYEHPILNDMANAGLAPIVGLNYKDIDEKAAKWLAERGDPYYKAVVDNNGRVGIDWGVIAVPETFIIDEHGTVIYKHTGPITRELVNSEMIPLLSINN